eukprot:CAMPEP_0171367560 /NCGR_PEP_ID=MMETSP0879-20121228/6161_1 /TAXON_ID=67004 /ORGANISM="Thalassiosira weissflogii, Strain CCMP1336" /LENGTH=1092 /DNA_ID=CAMNT_0011875619 /DNA_START=24 /DNA_END=3302 /DNA_ORIENTATION=+
MTPIIPASKLLLFFPKSLAVVDASFVSPRLAPCSINDAEDNGLIRRGAKIAGFDFVDVPQNPAIGHDDDFSSFHPIELHENKEGISASSMIRTIPRSNNGEDTQTHNAGDHSPQSPQTIIENMERHVWSSHSPKSGSGGLFLWYAPENSHDAITAEEGGKDWTETSNVDLRVGDWAINAESKISNVRWLACARQTRYWMGPAFGGKSYSSETKESSLFKNCLPLDTQFLLVELRAESTESELTKIKYALVLPLVDGSFRASLQSGKDTTLHPKRKTNDAEDSIFCHIDSFDKKTHFSSILSQNRTVYEQSGKTKLIRALYILVGSNPYKLLKQGFRDVADELQTFETLDRKQIPSMADDFGWCTWDAFYSDVTPEGVVDGVTKLREAGIQPRTVIIDDGWQDVTPLKVKHQQSTLAKITNGGGNKNPVTSSIRSFFKRSIVALIGSFFSNASKVIAAYYDRIVKNAKYDSTPNRIWRKLSSTVLKGELYNYFENETDFARQLNGFLPNVKFRGFEVQKSSNDAEKQSTNESAIGRTAEDIGEVESNNGLRNLVSTLKNDLGVKRVLCWHALHGYWRGVSPFLANTITHQPVGNVMLDRNTSSTPPINTERSAVSPSDSIPEHSEHLLRVEPIISWDSVSLFGVGLLSSRADLRTFYQRLHSPLKDAGVDGVKIDVQSGVAAVGGGSGGGPHLADLYTETMENSVKQHFASISTAVINQNNVDNEAINCINCMSHSTENIYRYKHTSIIRASDDFYPSRPYSHTVHLINVAYNSLFLREVCLPDWDMFQSLHPSASLHAAARAIGGCPVYVSDKPGNHDPELLKKLVFKDGSVPRASQSGVPTRDCLFSNVGEDGVTALKVFNWNSYKNRDLGKVVGSGVIAAFNVQGVMWDFERRKNHVQDPSKPILPVDATIRPRDVESFNNGENAAKGPFIAYGCQCRTFRVLDTLDSEISLKLGHREWDIFTIAPINQKYGLSFAPIGLGDMLNPSGAIVATNSLISAHDGDEKGSGQDSDLPTRIKVEIWSRGSGRFLAYSSNCPSKVIVHTESEPETSNELSFDYDTKKGMLGFPLPEEKNEPHKIVIVWDTTRLLQ